jgi:cytochrome oxidase Cu insertion factor (SCO1/SenC/PrrC family)
MPGMNSGLSDTDPTIVAAFRAALLHQGILILAILVIVAVSWVAVREFVPAARSIRTGSGLAAEPAGRRLLRIGFGILWLFDGLLQAQPAMAAGLPSQVIKPAADTSPGWVQHLVNWAGTSWSYHPIEAGAAAVWIQVGIGAWLLFAPAGRISRLGGLVSAGWGLVVWIFGEALGGLFAPGLSFPLGAPGAALIYCVAGLLLALPDRQWQTARLGRQLLAALGVFCLGMAVLQAWPGRGSWQGAAHGQLGSLAAMVASMASTPQPGFLAGSLRGFQSFDVAHGFGVNLVLVVVLAAIGAALLTGRPRPVRAALCAGALFCLAIWVIVQDLGFLGGLGTDPNSMIPLGLLTGGGYLAMVRLPATAESAERVPDAADPAAGPASDAADPAAPGRRAGWRPRPLVRAFGSASVRAVLAAWAAAIVLIGAAPMVLAQASPTADPIIAQAIDGDAAPLDLAAAPFSLTSQAGRPVSLASLRGKVVLLTFLDPVCTSDCPLIAQEFRAADQLLGGRAAGVELVAIVANPVYRSIAYTRAFDRQEQMSGLTNWLFLTGSLPQLEQAWRGYGIAAQVLPAGGMVAHNDVAFVIDSRGRTRNELDFDPGPGTASSMSSFAAELSDAAGRYLR